MKYCRNCGKELNSDIQYCPNCGASVSEEQSGKNENSYQESNADGSLWESLVEFFKALIEYMKEAGLYYRCDLTKSFRCRRIYRKILYARIVTARIRFRLLRTRQRLKQKDTVWGAGAVECVCSVRLDYCAERFSRALK